jgi:hypothetical protein
MKIFFWVFSIKALNKKETKPFKIIEPISISMF